MLYYMVCTSISYLLFLTSWLAAFETNITGPEEVAVGTDYNVTCTIGNIQGTFFKNNISVTETFINDTSSTCYVTHNANYKCYFKWLSLFHKEFKLEVSTQSDDVGETEWYCLSKYGRSDTIFVNVFQPTEETSSGSSPQDPIISVPTLPTPLPQATSALPSSTTQSISQGSTRPSSLNSTMPVMCGDGHDTSFPLGRGVGIVIGLIIGLLLSFVIITIYYCMNKKKKKRAKIDSYHADGGYLVPNVSSSSVTQTQGQSSVEMSDYESLGDTSPQAASEYEPLKLYEEKN